MKPAQKTAIVLTTTSADCVEFLVDRLRCRGYDVPILVTAPGPNAFLTDSHIENMRSRISSYALEVGGSGDSASQSRPAILLVSRSGQIEPLTAAYDPDVVLSLGFPYPLGPKLLSHRAKFVNLHAAPLPELPGPTPQIWPILRPDMFPPEDFVVTWHYMTAGVDEGRIITQTAVELERNDQRTASELHKLAVMQGLSGMDDALELVESGYEGHTQRKKEPLSEGSSSDFTGFLPDSARMITPDMTAAEIQILFQAIGDSEWPPLVHVHGGLYAVKEMAKPHREDDIVIHGEPGMAVRTGFTTTYHCMGGPLLFTLRKL
jgi:methionyl-tRNA formyltransferase